MTTISLTDIPPGFADAVHDAQRVFRRLLEAMSRPGRLQSVDGEGLVPPPGLGVAAAAVLLTMADAEVSVWLHPSYDDGTVASWLRFHTGARLAAQPASADWLVLPASAAAGGSWHDANEGTDEAPHTAATLLIDAPAFGGGATLTLSGPGIEHTEALAVAGITAEFWQARIARQPAFPRGVDLVVACGGRLAALPRSTHIQLEG